MNKEKFHNIFVMLREGIKNPDNVDWCTWKYMRKDVEVMITNGMMDYLHEKSS